MDPVAESQFDRAAVAVAQAGADEGRSRAAEPIPQPEPVAPRQEAAQNSPMSRSRAMMLPLALGAATMSGCVAVAAMNPGDDGVPLCWSRSVFGVDCPFCGGLRATNALVRGQFGNALDHNVLLAVALPVTVLMWLWWLSRQWRDPGVRPRRVPTWIYVGAGVLLVAFGIVRNLGGPAWIRWMYSDAYVG